MEEKKNNSEATQESEEYNPSKQMNKQTREEAPPGECQY